MSTPHNNEEDDDDEFEELFSFGNTPTNAAAAARSSSPLDFGLDDDDNDVNVNIRGGVDGTNGSFTRPAPLSSSSPRNAKGRGGEGATKPAVFRIGSRVKESDLNESTDGANIFGDDSKPAKEKHDNDDDSFLDMLDEVDVTPKKGPKHIAGTNPPPLIPSPSVAMNDGGVTATAAAVMNDDEFGVARPRLPTQNDDDFHMHDSGTRDFLEWLDGDGGVDSRASGATTTAPFAGNSAVPSLESEIILEEEDLISSSGSSPTKETAMGGGKSTIASPSSAGSSTGFATSSPTLETTNSFDLDRILDDVGLGPTMTGEVTSSPDGKNESQRVSSEAMKLHEGRGILDETEKPNSIGRGVSAPATLSSTSFEEFDLTTTSQVIKDPEQSPNNRSNTPVKSSDVSNRRGFGIDSSASPFAAVGRSEYTSPSSSSSHGQQGGDTKSATMTAADVTSSGKDQQSSLMMDSPSSLHGDNDSEGGTTADTSQQPGAQTPFKQKDIMRDSSLEMHHPSSPPSSPLLSSSPSSLRKVVNVIFDSLSDAIRSPLSTSDQIRTLLLKEKYGVSTTDRPYLWCKVVCGKTLDDVMESSVADSYQKWDADFDWSKLSDKESQIVSWLKDEASVLAERIVISSTAAAAGGGGESKESLRSGDADAADAKAACRNLGSLLLFHYHNGGGSTKTTGKNSMVDSIEWDPLLPPVACAVLSTGLPPSVASVVLANIMPVAMPLMALTNVERRDAVRMLHIKFYLVACYHLPLLVLHLDRSASGWYWPKKLQTRGGHFIGSAQSEDDNGGGGDDAEGEGCLDEDGNATKMGRNLEAHGVIPMSWFISHMAGECGGAFMDARQLLALWDVLLTNGDNSLKFFLALAVLEKHSDTLLMLRGEELVVELSTIMEFRESTVEEEDFIGSEEQDGEVTDDDNEKNWVRIWCNRARVLSESTPTSVVDSLRKAEDEAVNHALVERQRIAEEKLQARLEEEAKAHREAMEAEQEKREEEARAALTRARLVVFYKKYNPEKVESVDKILGIYKGRTDVLDSKLKAKYGVGFQPPSASSNPLKLSATASKLLSTMNQGLHMKKHQIVQGAVKRHAAARLQKRGKRPGSGFETDITHQVAVSVSSDEILPIICAARGSKGSGAHGTIRGRYSSEVDSPLKFYLVDSRPEDTAKEQGRFPTSISLSPEALLDPDRIQQNVEMFESFRGAVHFCIMGEGISSFPDLYGHPLSPKEQELAEDDESRTSNCALFFIKRGFPFVSILDGGFAAAHAWLTREGHSWSLKTSSLLVDYDDQLSLFAQLESAYQEQQELANATTREKTTRALQKLLDSSMTTLTESKNRIEILAAAENRQKVKESVTKLFTKQGAVDSVPGDTDAETSEGLYGFKNPFASLRQSMGERRDVPERNFQYFDDIEDSLELQSSGEGTSSTEREDMPGRNPFARWKQTAAAGTINLTNETTTADSEQSQGNTLQPGPFRRNLFAGFGQRNIVPDTSQSSAQKDESLSKESQITERNSMGGVLKRNPFAAIGTKGTAEPKVTDRKSSATQKPERRNLFAAIGSKSAAEAKLPERNSSAAQNAERNSGGLGGILKRNPFGGIGVQSRGSYIDRQTESQTEKDKSESDRTVETRTFRPTFALLSPATTQPITEGYSASEEAILFHEDEENTEDRGMASSTPDGEGTEVEKDDNTTQNVHTAGSVQEMSSDEKKAEDSLNSSEGTEDADVKHLNLFSGPLGAEPSKDLFDIGG